MQGFKDTPTLAFAGSVVEGREYKIVVQPTEYYKGFKLPSTAQTTAPQSIYAIPPYELCVINVVKMNGNFYCDVRCELAGIPKNNRLAGTRTSSSSSYLYYKYEGDTSSRSTSGLSFDIEMIQAPAYLNMYNYTVSAITAFPDVKCESLADLFYNQRYMTSFAFPKDWDCESVKSMSHMFAICRSLTTLTPPKVWKTSNVETFYNMFNNCAALTYIDLSKLDTSGAKSLRGMFAGCSNLESVDVSKWDTSNVEGEGFVNMFMNCSKLNKLDVSRWDVSKATSLAGMFYGCNSLGEIDVSGWDVSNVESM